MTCMLHRPERYYLHHRGDGVDVYVDGVVRVDNAFKIETGLVLLGANGDSLNANADSLNIK